MSYNHLIKNCIYECVLTRFEKSGVEITDDLERKITNAINDYNPRFSVVMGTPYMLLRHKNTRVSEKNFWDEVIEKIYSKVKGD